MQTFSILVRHTLIVMNDRKSFINTYYKYFTYKVKVTIYYNLNSEIIYLFSFLLEPKFHFFNWSVLFGNAWSS